MSGQAKSRGQVAAFRTALRKWSRRNRRPFFWRSPTRSPFLVLVTEVLLSRTRASVAEGAARKILDRFPTASALAEAAPDVLVESLRPLGLQNKRMNMLIACARQLVEEYGGAVPSDPEELSSLPYIGPYAVDAIRCFGFGIRVPVVDINVARLFHRVFGLPAPHERRRHPASLRAFVASTLPHGAIEEYNWSLLDLAGVLCTARRPRCGECPVREICKAHATGACGCPQNMRVHSLDKDARK